MHFYRTFHSTLHDRPRYERTLEDAKEVVKTFNEDQRPLVRVELVEIPTDKLSLCNVFNTEDGWPGEAELLRTWCGTTRGGLKEIANGE